MLVGEGLRPSAVATGHRDVTQRAADALHRSHPDAVGLRWWSVVEASWINVTLFSECAATHMRPDAPRGLGPDEDVVVADVDRYGWAPDRGRARASAGCLKATPCTASPDGSGGTSSARATRASSPQGRFLEGAAEIDGDVPASSDATAAAFSCSAMSPAGCCTCTSGCSGRWAADGTRRPSHAGPCGAAGHRPGRLGPARPDRLSPDRARRPRRASRAPRSRSSPRRRRPGVARYARIARSRRTIGRCSWISRSSPASGTSTGARSST